MDPIINMEETIGKVVGRRRPPANSLAYGLNLQRSGNALSRSMRLGGICPKGVYRFRSHEEANTWMTQMLARRRKLKS